MGRADEITEIAAQRWPVAKQVFGTLRVAARELGLEEAFGMDSIELTHRRSDAVLLRLRSSGYIEVPFDSMSRNRGLNDASFQRSVVDGLQAAGFSIRTDQAGKWPQIPAVHVDSESRLDVLRALLVRLAGRANRVRT